MAGHPEYVSWDQAMTLRANELFFAGGEVILYLEKDMLQ
jgi:hypothetical protein